MLKNICTALIIYTLSLHAVHAQSMLESTRNKQENISYLNGKNFGVFLSKQLNKDDRAIFIKGLMEGIDSQSFSQSELQQFEAQMSAWFTNIMLDSKTKASYAVGYLAGLTPKPDTHALDDFAYLQGFIDVRNHPNLTYLNQREATKIAKAQQKIIIHNTKLAIMHTNRENKKIGDAFLEENASKEGIIKTDSGLQYKIIKAGIGKNPKISDLVQLNVLGKKLTGETFFDSTKDLKKPLIMTVGSTIPAWRDALTKMAPGAEWELYVPSNLAYDIHGFKNIIEPGETLIYTLELIEIK